jgi:polysaccharide deacetylase family protein (PEP-CTERM system associated)
MNNSTILSFDIEEHHRIEAALGLKCNESQMDDYSSRAIFATRRLVQILDESNCKATFFVVGELAKKCPNLVREIHDAGHEVGSHGWDHRPVTRLTRAAFREDIAKCKATLEQIIGAPVSGYRAPTFSIIKDTAWAIDELLDAGYTYDSSIFPVHHDRYGVVDAPTMPFICYGQNERLGIMELPPLTLRTGFSNIPIAGGGYFRLFPLLLLKAGIWFNRNQEPAVSMLYFHPWEFDAKQPKLPLTKTNRWRTYVGIGRSESRLKRIINRFKSITKFRRAIDVVSELQANQLIEYRFNPDSYPAFPNLSRTNLCHT